MNSTIKRTLEVLKNDNWWRETTSNKFLVKTGLDLIEEALTPPTSEEVCEALNKWVSDNVEDAISNVMYGDNSFYYYDEDDYVECIVQKTFCGCLAFGINDLPLKIVGLITRFFEELERKENEKN